MSKDVLSVDLGPNEQAEELIKRTEVKDTPFQVIQTDDKVFGVMGKYRLTEPLEDSEENKLKIMNELLVINWNKILNVILCVMDTESDIIKEQT